MDSFLLVKEKSHFHKFPRAQQPSSSIPYAGSDTSVHGYTLKGKFPVVLLSAVWARDQKFL